MAASAPRVGVRVRTIHEASLWGHVCVFYCGRWALLAVSPKSHTGRRTESTGVLIVGPWPAGGGSAPDVEINSKDMAVGADFTRAYTQHGVGLCLSGDPCDRYERKRSKKERDEESTYRDTEDGDHTARAGLRLSPQRLLTKLFLYVASGPAGHTS